MACFNVCNDFKVSSVKSVLFWVILRKFSVLPVFVISNELIENDNTKIGDNISISHDYPIIKYCCYSLFGNAFQYRLGSYRNQQLIWKWESLADFCTIGVFTEIYFQFEHNSKN